MAYILTAEERYAAEVRRVYAEAEAVMLTKVRKRLQAGIEDDGWAAQKLAEVKYLNRDIQIGVKQLQQHETLVEQAILAAYKNGARNAVDDLRAAGITQLVPERMGVKMGLRALVATTVGAVQSTHLRILRSGQDIYRRTIGEAAAQALVGTMTRREAAQVALNRFADAGVTGFIDTAGRGWDLTSYVEMAVRTAHNKAANEGRLDKYAANDRDLVIVSSHGSTCSLCAPWEGEVLSASGRTPGYPTVAMAEAAGLLHPNCRHSLNLYIPGVTKAPEEQYDPEAYEAEQTQRHHERMIRKWKNREAVALSPEAAAKAKDKVRYWQQAQREHIRTANLAGEERHEEGWITLRRDYEREQSERAR